MNVASSLGAPSEGVADGEDAEAAEGVEHRHDEEEERHQAVQHVGLDARQVQLRHGDLAVHRGDPAVEQLAPLHLGVVTYMTSENFGVSWTPSPLLDIWVLQTGE